MKFLCVDCDAQMASVAQAAPPDRTLVVMFRCPKCEREVAMLTNPVETDMVKSLCVELGGRTTAAQPFEGIRARMKTNTGEPSWSAEAERRLLRVPGFVRDGVRRLYSEWAAERGIAEITLDIMDEARSDVDFDGM